MNILFLTHRIPFPPNKGDKIRSFNIIKYLSQRHTIYLGATLECRYDDKHISKLKPYCKEIKSIYFRSFPKLISNIFSRLPFSAVNFYDKSLQIYVDDVLANKQIDTVICYCSGMAEYIFRSSLFKSGWDSRIKLVMDFVDLDSDKWMQYAKYTAFPFNILYKTESNRLLNYEIKINHAFHNSIFVSRREADVFERKFPAARNIDIITNGVDTDFFKPQKRKFMNSKPVLLFTGVMNYFANEDGVIWFSRQVYPIIKASIPDVQFYIVGKKPTGKVKKLERLDGVTVTGYVKDIRAYYELADVCVIPLRIARGLQNKVLEAMATGNAVVATPNAADGIIHENGQDMIVTADANEMAQNIINLLNNHQKRKELAEKALVNIRNNYVWKDTLSKFDRLME